VLRKGHILAILVIGVSIITIPVFAVEKGVVHGQESESRCGIGLVLVRKN